MPQPTSTDVHVSQVLTNISVAYMGDLTQYVSTSIFPVVPVDKQYDMYYVYNKGDWFRDEAQKRVDEEQSAGSGYRLSQESYRAEVYAFHKDIPRQVRLNADAPINLDRDATEFVTRRLVIRQEVDWGETYFTTGVWDTDVTGVAAAPGAGQFLQWNDAASDPIADIELGKETILSTTGYEANTLLLGYKVFNALKYHPDIIERFKYTSREAITEDMLAAFFEIANVRVLRGIFNSAQEGAADNMTFIHGNHALLAYVAPNPGLLVPSAGYTFMWRGISAGLGQNVAISRMNLEGMGLKVIRIEGEAAWDQKAVATDMGYFFADAVA